MTAPEEGRTADEPPTVSGDCSLTAVPQSAQAAIPHGKAVKVCRTCAEEIPTAAAKCRHCDSYQDYRRHFAFSGLFLAQLVSLVSVSTLLVAALANRDIFPNYRVEYTRIGHTGPVLLVAVLNHAKSEAAIADSVAVIRYRKEFVASHGEDYLAAVPLEVVNEAKKYELSSGLTIKRLAIQGFSQQGETGSAVFNRNIAYFYKMLLDRGASFEKALKPSVSISERNEIKALIALIRRTIFCSEDENDTPVKLAALEQSMNKYFETTLDFRYADAQGSRKEESLPMNLVSLVWWLANYPLNPSLDPRFEKIRKEECPGRTPLGG